jgi:tripartite-type tricarboxylate transporter receptor subunit TctC
MKPRISRRTLAGAALGLLGAPALVSAQDAFPNRPITLVVPSSPEALAARMERETAAWAEVVRAAKITAG